MQFKMVDLLGASFLQNLRCLAGNNNLVKNSMSRTESLKTWSHMKCYNILGCENRMRWICSGHGNCYEDGSLKNHFCLILSWPIISKEKWKTETIKIVAKSFYRTLYRESEDEIPLMLCFCIVTSRARTMHQLGC